MDAAAANYFNYATMIIIARRVAKLAQTDPVAAADCFDMHAASLSEEERAAFSNAIAEQTIKLAA